jgi:hypothetical protein
VFACEHEAHAKYRPGKSEPTTVAKHNRSVVWGGCGRGRPRRPQVGALMRRSGPNPSAWR